VSKFKLIFAVLGIVAVSSGAILYFLSESKDKTVVDLSTINKVKDESLNGLKEIQEDTIISKEWKNLKFDSCVVYFCKDFKEVGFVADLKNEYLNPDITVLERGILSFNDAEELKESLSIFPKTNVVADCIYQPHHAFVFFLDKKVVASVSLCLDCMQYRSKPGANVNWSIAETIIKKYELPWNKYEIYQYLLKNELLDNESSH